MERACYLSPNGAYLGWWNGQRGVEFVLIYHFKNIVVFNELIKVEVEQCTCEGIPYSS